MASIHAPAGHVAAPVFITQQRKLRDFLADQDRLASIRSDWLYKLVGTEAREQLLRANGFTPVRVREFPRAPAYARA